MKAKIKPAYVAVKQEPYCCVPACIQMILDRRDLASISQEEIGNGLGLVIPEEDFYYFKNAATGRKPVYGWGTRINLKKYDLNIFFKKRKIPLESVRYSLETIADVPEFIAHNLEDGNDILTCYRFGSLYNKDNDNGHASLIEELNDSDIKVVDPRYAKRKTVYLDNLIKAIAEHRSRNSAFGGFWVIQC